MSKPLAGRVAAVTGAGRGIGRAHALALAAHGAQVVVNDVGASVHGEGQSRVADEVVQEIRTAGGEAVTHLDDISTRAGARSLVARALEAFGQLDVLVNNAGILRDRAFLNISDDDLDSVLRVHLYGSFYCAQEAFRHMKERGRGGRIIHTTSTSGIDGNFGQANYGAAKAGIFGLMRVIAIEGEKYGITSNCLSPVAYTRMTESSPRFKDAPADLMPEVQSPIVVYLASEAGGRITGQVLQVRKNRIHVRWMASNEGIRLDHIWSFDEVDARIDKIMDRSRDVSGAENRFKF